MKTLHAGRFYTVVTALLLMVIGLTYRLVILTVYESDFLQGQSDARVIRTISVPVSRGNIYDRNGLPMAASTVLNSLWMDPGEVNTEQVLQSDLANLIGMSNKSLAEKISTNKSKSFVYLKRHMQSPLDQKVLNLKLSGLSMQKEFKRIYPDSESVSQLIGRTNIDDKGLEGIELAYEDWLKGQQGKKVVTKDRLGRILSNVDTVTESKQGNDLYLSIDKRDQAVAYDALTAGVKQSGAKSGSAVVIDSKTGEVLALANYPSYDPNSSKIASADLLRNRAITDLFEPGSTIKPFSMLHVLESGKNKDDQVYVADGNMTLEGHTIHDVHNKEQYLSLTDILVHSSNVGIAKLILDLPGDEFKQELSNFGFGESTGSGFPGEPAGMLIEKVKQGSFDQASLSFGYGMATTLLQLGRAYLKLSSCDLQSDISLLKLDQDQLGKPSLSPAPDSQKACRQVHNMMAKVTAKGGTGFRAAVKGYKVAGKTGTSYISTKNGYDSDKYTSSFAGFAPAKAPRYVVAVVLWEPSYDYRYGGKSAAPIFAKIMQHMLVFKNQDNTTLNNKKKRRVN